MYAKICERLTGKVLVRFAYTTRTFGEQSALYAIGRNGDKRKIVTRAKAGMSYHNYGLAFDIVLLIDKNGDGKHETASWDTKADFDKDTLSDWQEVVAICKSWGWTWGGDFKRFKDEPHFEKSFGYKPSELLAKHNKKDFIPNSQYVNI